MALLDLLVAASMPVLKVLLVTALGFLLALDHINVLGEDTRKHMNNIVFYVFNPALVASNLSRTITFESMTKLWFMPLNVLLTFIIGSVLGWIVLRITTAPVHLRGLVLGCCAAGNMGNMLLIIIPAVCKEKGSPFGAPDSCRQYGLAYASLSMAVGAVCLWSYVYNIVRISSSNRSKEVEINDSSVRKSSRETSISQKQICEAPFFTLGDQLPYTRYEGKAQVAILDNAKQHFGMLLRKMNLKRLFAPSTTGAIVGFIVGLVPQIQRSMIGDEAPLRVIQDSASLLGDGAIPAITLIMGGNLLKGIQGSAIHKSLIIGIIVARYIALPLIGIAIVKAAVHYGLVHGNPLYQFVLLLQFAVPPAMNIGTITQLFGDGESECSVILLWTYALASISLTLWSAIFMWLVA
ncbi:protein PIN-LIKES 3-like [Diospyros lotus]|uniref:protein PIN-LIKES 3-like n=1 Tax=Diospyros lotus TaxID=55363 RepID=UPI002259BFE9|nr:protein PIN-LIKES 3-like [Diospyros lotus]